MTIIFTIISTILGIFALILIGLLMYLFFTEVLCFRFQETFYSEISECDLTVEVVYSIPEAIEAKRFGNKLKLVGLF